MAKIMQTSNPQIEMMAVVDLVPYVKNSRTLITELTFDHWAKQEYDNSDYKEAYFQAFAGDEKRAIMGTIIGNDDAKLSTNELLRRAKEEYISKLLNQPREAVLSLDVLDSLTPAQKTEAQKRFYDLDVRIVRRLQDEGSAKNAALKEAQKPYEDSLKEVDAEIKRLDGVAGPDTQKVDGLRSRKLRLEKAIYGIGQNQEPDGRLLKSKPADPVEETNATPATRNVMNCRSGDLALFRAMNRSTTVVYGGLHG